MKLYELWLVSAQSHIFIKRDGCVELYVGGRKLGSREVVSVKATSYPNYSSVIEVEIR